jgi:hypothetical protein
MRIRSNSIKTETPKVMLPSSLILYGLKDWRARFVDETVKTKVVGLKVTRVLSSACKVAGPRTFLAV